MSFNSFDFGSWIPLFIFGAICSLIFTSFIILLCHHFWCKQFDADKRPIATSIKCISVLVLACFLSAIIFDNLYVLFVKFPFGSITTLTRNFYSATNTCWAIGYTCIYWLFFKRLDSSFECSIFALKTSTKALFYSLLSIYLVSQLATSVMWSLLTVNQWGWDDDWNGFITVIDPIVWLRMVVDFLLNGLIVYLFCSKIYQLTVQHNVGQLKGIKTRSSSNAPNLGKMSTVDVIHRQFKSTDIFSMMIKYFFLSLLTMVSTQLFTASDLLVNAAISHAAESNEFEFYYATFKVWYVLRATDALVSSMYILLTFQFSETWYSRCCGTCHNTCVHAWEKSVKSEIHEHLKLARNKQQVVTVTEEEQGHATTV